MTIAFRMALRSVFDNWRHSLATLSSIALGLAGVALLQGYILECKMQFGELYEKKSMYGQVLVEAEQKGDEKALMGEASARQSYEIIKAMPEVDEVVRFMPIEGLIAGKNNSFNFFGLAYDIEAGKKLRGEIWAWDALFGAPLEGGSQSRILVGKGLAELLGCKFSGKTIRYLPDGRYIPDKSRLNCFGEAFLLTGLTPKGRVNAWETEISGIMDAGLRELDDNWVMMPLDEAQTFYDNSRLSMMGIRLKAGSDPEDFSVRLGKVFEKSKLKLDARPWQRHRLAELYHSNMDLLGTLRNFILLIVLLVCALAMLSTITRNIMERSREVGSLRAIGYERGFIVSLFAWEGLILGVLGSLCGIALVLLFSLGINAAGLTYLTPFTTAPIPFRVAYSAATYLGLGLLLSACSGLIAAFVCRMRTRQSIAEALIS